MSCLLSELKQIPAPWVTWQDRSAWSPAVMPSFVAGTDFSRAVPKGAHPLLSSVSQDKLSPALGWLLAWDMELLLLLAGAGCSHMERARSWAGTAQHGRAGARNCPATCPRAKSLRLYNWVLQGVRVPQGLLWNCLRNAS